MLVLVRTNRQATALGGVTAVVVMSRRKPRVTLANPLQLALPMWVKPLPDTRHFVLLIIYVCSPLSAMYVW